jgi:peptidoglycan/xylan/chitin deacetylase (PgdA/CDA1 family)
MRTLPNLVSRRAALRRIGFQVLRWSLVPDALRATVQRGRLTILVYHDPPPATFEAHLRLLRRRYSLVALSDALDALSGGATRLPPRPLAITLDDGHRGNIDLLEVLERLQVRATIFLCSSIVGTGRRFWFDHAADADHLKRVTDAERVEALRLRGLAEDADVGSDDALSAADIEVLGRAVDFGSHGKTHAILPRCDEPKARREIEESRVELGRRFGIDARLFAYPNGDYTEREIDLVHAAGYGFALTVDAGFNTATTHPLRLRRLGVDDVDGLAELVVKASGLWAFLRRMRGDRRLHLVARRSRIDT